MEDRDNIAFNPFEEQLEPGENTAAWTCAMTLEQSVSVSSLTHVEAEYVTFNLPVFSSGVTVMRPVFKSSYFIGVNTRFGAFEGSPGVWP